MKTLVAVFIVGAIAFLISAWMFPKALKYAKKHGIVDNPNARKLQRVPVPVLGGVAVYTGLLVATIAIVLITHSYRIIPIIFAMTVMLGIGVWDDIKNLPATLRFIVEIALVWGLMASTGKYIDSFHGLWGIQGVDVFVSLPLSLLAGVGIINAVNLIDGVDGYSSSYGILTNMVFALIFFSVGYRTLGLLSVACACAIVPFFFHNVFGKSSKMFFGDGGTLMLGTLMSFFVFSLLSSKTICMTLAHRGIGTVALALAVLAIPVFDTLRVMSARIVRGKSPFSPDKTHLHHLFIEMKFSHIGTSFSILMIQCFIILVWGLCWLAGVSVDVQLYVVLILGIGVTFVFYRFMKIQQQGGPKDEDGIPEGTLLWKGMCKLGEKTHFEKGIVWKFLERLVDGKK